MSLQPQAIAPIPEETQRVARAVFPKDNLYLRLRDEIGTLFDDPLFAPWFPSRGQPAESPWRLALITGCTSAVASNTRNVYEKRSPGATLNQVPKPSARLKPKSNRSKLKI